MSSERFWNGSVWHKLPEEAWDKFRRLNKVPDKFLQYAAIVVGNHLTCLFCVFLVFLKFCLLAVLFLVFLFSDYVNQKGCVFLLRFHFVIFIYCHMFPPQLIFLSFPSECFRCAAFGRCPLHVFLFNELDHRPQNCVLKSCLSDILFQIGSM